MVCMTRCRYGKNGKVTVKVCIENKTNGQLTRLKVTQNEKKRARCETYK